METVLISQQGKYWTIEGIDSGIEYGAFDTKEQAIEGAKAMVSEGYDVKDYVIEG
jgi:hypothetical protein